MKTRGKLREEIEASKPDPQEATTSLVSCDCLSSGLLWTYKSWAVGDFGDTDIHEITENLAKLVKATAGAWETHDDETRDAASANADTPAPATTAS